jgi:hypothetical protein
MEVELVALETITSEAKWLCEFFMDLPVINKLVSAILLHCDNESVITIVGSAKKNLKSTRHVK